MDEVQEALNHISDVQYQLRECTRLLVKWSGSGCSMQQLMIFPWPNGLEGDPRHNRMLIRALLGE